jgi:hypothetical protein
LRVLQRLLRLIEPGSGRVAVCQQLPLAFEVGPRVIQLPLRGGEGGFGRTQRALLVFRIELGQHLSGLDPSTDIDWSLDHPPAKAKSKLCSGCGHSPDWKYLRRFDFAVRQARGQ